MKHVRWYDKNPDLSKLFEIIRKFDDTIRHEIASDVIQILMKDFGLNSDEEINRISKNYNYDCKRWYDEDLDLFTTFEIIKSFSEEKQEQIIQKIVETILYIYLEKGDIRE